MVHNVSQDYSNILPASFFCGGVFLFFFFFLTGNPLGEVSVDRISKGAHGAEHQQSVWKLKKTAGRKQTIRKKRYPTQDQL